MKKAKILVPAVAALVLSSAAAVTGTVAWFTASLNASTATSNITIVKTGSDLDYKLTANYGTTLGSAAPNQTVEHSQFIDGSVDLATGNVYKAIFNKEGTQVTSFATVNDGKDFPSATQFRATKFTATFTMHMENEVVGTTYGVFVDPEALSAAVTQTKQDEKALRVGFRNPATNKYVVWAPYDEDGTLKYVKSTTGTGDATASNATYSQDNQILSTDATTITTYSDAHKLFLGNLVRPEAAGGDNWAANLDVEIYTWFDGSVIVNETTLGSGYTYEIGFNAVKKLA